MLKFLKILFVYDEGALYTEYVLLVIFIALVALISVVGLGNKAYDLYNSFSTYF